MNKKLLLVIGCFLTLASGAQNYEMIKMSLVLNQYEKAKGELDKAMADAKFTSKPEAYILKATIYGALAMDSKNKNTSAAMPLMNEADAAFKKYKEMDPAMSLLSDVAYQIGPINIYSAFYTAGYDDYAAKNWNSAAVKMKKAVEYSDLLIEKKLLGAMTLDTNALILAGISAENSGNIADAVRYYTRMADARLKGDGFESVYRYLVSYYFQQKDFTAFDKYKNTGASLYPSSEYFKYDKVDFAVGLQATFAGKLKALEELLAADPNNSKGNQVMGEIIYDVLNPKNETDPLPPNADELEKKMVTALNKVISLKPGYENPFIYMGDHFINKAVAVDKERTANKDAGKKKELDAKYVETLSKAKDPYEKAVSIFKAKSSLTLADKAQYKKCVSYLTDIAAIKKVQAKNTNSPDAAKYEAEEKMWNALWESIK